MLEIEHQDQRPKCVLFYYLSAFKFKALKITRSDAVVHLALAKGRAC